MVQQPDLHLLNISQFLGLISWLINLHNNVTLTANGRPCLFALFCIARMKIGALDKNVAKQEMFRVISALTFLTEFGPK